MNIHCLIIDGKPLAIDVLISYVAEVDFLELAGHDRPIERFIYDTL